MICKISEHSDRLPAHTFEVPVVVIVIWAGNTIFANMLPDNHNLRHSQKGYRVRGLKYILSYDKLQRVLKSYQAMYFLKVPGPGKSYQAKCFLKIQDPKLIPGNTLSGHRRSLNHARRTLSKARAF